MGLAVAYRALKRAHDVTLLEAAPEAGGMAAHFDFGVCQSSATYHFVCKSDEATFDLLAELALGTRGDCHSRRSKGLSSLRG
jgi:protoporphyrinogen oxidase